MDSHCEEICIFGIMISKLIYSLSIKFINVLLFIKPYYFKVRLNFKQRCIECLSVCENVNFESINLCSSLKCLALYL